MKTEHRSTLKLVREATSFCNSKTETTQCTSIFCCILIRHNSNPQLAFCVGQFVQPFLIGELVDLIARGPGNGLWDGLWLACGLGAASLFCSVCIAAAFLNNRVLGLGVRAATMMAVYQVCSKKH